MYCDCDANKEVIKVIEAEEKSSKITKSMVAGVSLDK